MKLEELRKRATSGAPLSKAPTGWTLVEFAPVPDRFQRNDQIRRTLITDEGWPETIDVHWRQQERGGSVEYFVTTLDGVETHIPSEGRRFRVPWKPE